MGAQKLLKVIYSTLVLLLVSGPLFSQNWPFELWHEGKIVLVERDTLKGLVKYDFQQDLVQFTYQDKIAEVYTARKVLSFEIFDESVHQYRHFFALPYSNASGYKSPVFFELLEAGKFTLLSREVLEYKTYSSPYNIGSASRLVLVYKYFFLRENGQIEPFTGNKNDLIAMMGKNGKDVQKFMKANRLRLEEKSDFARIVAYYNSLFETGS